MVHLLGTAKSLDKLPPRIQRMKMKLMRFCYMVIHVHGKELYRADTQSRPPIVEVKDDDDLTDEVHAFVNVVMQGVLATDTRLQEIK